MQRSTRNARRLALVMLAALLALLAPAAAQARGPAFIGKWEMVAGEERGKRMALPPSLKMVFEFRMGGVLIQTQEVAGRKPVSVKGRWKRAGKTLKITLKGREEEMTFTVKGKALTLGKKDRRGKLIFQRPGSGAVKVSAADRKRTREGMQRYILKSKAVEALEGLDKLKVGAKMSYMSDHYDRTGKLIPNHFPRGRTGWVPKVPCCRQPGKKCRPDPKAWDGEPWKSVHFQMNDPHHFQWRYTVKGRGKKARVILEARADLDCDGKYSRYKMEGRIVKSEPVFGKVIKKDPLE